jgi:copper chaperone CopZ
MRKAFNVNMSCHSCEMLLSDAIGGIGGVRSVRADHKSGKVEVDFGAPATEGKIIDAITSEGYKVSG